MGDALTLLAACEAVYDSPQIIAGPDGRDAASYDPVTRTLAFRGTLTTGLAAESDWINDFHADLVSHPSFPGRVHDGFLSSFLNLLPAIKGFSPARITGHSKGGAIAFLAGWYFRAYSPVVVTFAAAKIGNDGFARNYNVPCFRYENPSDIVPRLPFWYSNPGCQITPPMSFVPPRGFRLNHSLDSGYKPWVK